MRRERLTKGYLRKSMCAYSSGQPLLGILGRGQNNKAPPMLTLLLRLGGVRCASFWTLNGAVSCWQPAAQDVTEPVVGHGALVSKLHKYPTLRSITDLYRVHDTTSHYIHSTTLRYTALVSGWR